MRLNDKQDALCQAYLDEVLKANENINLTRINDRDNASLLHLEDSLLGLEFFNDAPEGRYGDLGSGGGFPGVPLGIASGRNTILVDSVKKKSAKVAEILNSLSIDNISCIDCRIEELAKDQPQSFALLTARALTNLSSLMELATPLLQEGGRLLAYKSNRIDDELRAANKIERAMALYLIDDRHYFLSDGITERRILVYEKRGVPELSLPRRIGMAQKRPYTASKG